VYKRQLLASIPVVIYFLIFTFQYGYSGYYGAPTNFQSFSLLTLYDVGFLLIPFFVIFAVSIIGSFTPHNILDGADSAVTNIGTLLLSAYFIYNYSSWNYFGFIFATLFWAAILIFRTFIQPLFLYNSIEGYIKKIHKYYEDKNIRKSKSIHEMIFNFGTTRKSTYVIISVCLLVVSISFGYNAAKNESTHYILKGTDYSVIRFYDDKALLVNTSNNKIGDEFIIKSVFDKDSIFIRRENGKYMKS
jgi:hypothetical protein